MAIDVSPLRRMAQASREQAQEYERRSRGFMAWLLGMRHWCQTYAEREMEWAKSYDKLADAMERGGGNDGG